MKIGNIEIVKEKINAIEKLKHILGSMRSKKHLRVDDTDFLIGYFHDSIMTDVACEISRIESEIEKL